MSVQKSYRINNGPLERIDRVRRLINDNLKPEDKPWAESAVVNFLLSTNEYEVDDSKLLYYYTNIYKKPDGRKKWGIMKI